MLVKCPKCRYHFDVPAWPGATQLQCNCARCGTPFTFIVDNGEEAPEGAKSSDDADNKSKKTEVTAAGRPAGNAASSSARSAAQSSAVSTGSKPSGGASTNSGTYSGPKPPPFSFSARQSNAAPRPSYPSVSGKPAKKHLGCIGKMVLCVLVIGAVIFLLMLQCDSEEKYNTSPIVSSSSSNQGSVQAADTQYDENAKREKAPKWIQGYWHVDTEFGGISLSIRGDRVVETSGGLTCSGRYRYQNHRLFCDFGDGKMFIYRLDEENRSIDAGDGLMMEKVDRD